MAARRTRRAGTASGGAGAEPWRRRGLRCAGAGPEGSAAHPPRRGMPSTTPARIQARRPPGPEPRSGPRQRSSPRGRDRQGSAPHWRRRARSRLRGALLAPIERVTGLCRRVGRQHVSGILRDAAALAPLVRNASCACGGQPVEALPHGAPERRALRIPLGQVSIDLLGNVKPAARAVTPFDPERHSPQFLLALHHVAPSPRRRPIGGGQPASCGTLPQDVAGVRRVSRRHRLDAEKAEFPLSYI